MNKNVRFSIIIINFLFCLFSCIKYKEISITPVAVRDIEVCSYNDMPDWAIHEHITYEQAVEDADDICYLLDTCYIGYDEMLKNGYSDEVFLASVKETFSNSSLIRRDEFCKFLYTQLLPYVHDAHASIGGYILCQDADVFFSDYYVIPSDKGYEIVSPSPEEHVGIILADCPDACLFSYPSKGENVYRLGTVSFNLVDEIVVQISSGALPVSVNKGKVFEKTGEELSLLSTDDSLYIKCTTFLPDCLREDKNLDDFVTYADLAKHKKYAIVDLRENGGGLGMYQFEFLKKIFINEEKSFIDYIANRILLCKINAGIDKSMYICSPLVVKSLSCFREQYAEFGGTFVNIKEFEPEYQIVNPHRSLLVSCNTTGIRSSYKSDYSGTLIFIIDRNSASAAEALCIEAKSVFPESQVFIIGENSAGAMGNGTPLQYILKNSRIIVNFPMQGKMDKAMSFRGEGVGIFPDYWSTTEDLNDTLYYITGDSKMRSLLFPVFNKETY